MAHALLSPSSLYRRAHCPGSLRMERAAPETPDKPEGLPETSADRGRRLHELISAGILDPSKRLEYMAEAGAEDAWILEACWAESQRLWDILTAAQRSRAKVLVEKTIDLAVLNMEQGTPDLAIVCPGTDAEDGILILRDWKSGSGWVPKARWNLQLAAYAAALMRQYEVDGQANIGILQPPTMVTADSWMATKSDMADVEKRIRLVVELAERPEAPLVPGGHCQFCRARSTCTPRLMVAAEVRQIANPVEVITNLPVEARRQLYERLKDAIGMLDKAKDAIDSAILTGALDVPGYGIGPGRKGRFWTAPPQEIISVLANMASAKGLSEGDVYEPISVAAAEKLLGKKEIAATKMVGEKEGNLTVKRVKE